MRDLKSDFGAVGDDITDDTSAIQSALDWAATAHDRLDVPPGFYKVTAPLSLVQKSNFAVSGRCKQAGTYNTAFRWHGAPGGTMLLLDGVRDSEWTDLGLDARISSGEPSILLDIDKITGGGGISRKNAFRRSLFRGGSLATVRIGHVSVGNNEANLFEDVTNACVVGSQWVNGVTGGPVGYLVENVNAKGQQVTGGEINGKEAAVYCSAGSFHLLRVEISGCNVWVRKNGAGEPCVVQGCDGDSSKTFLEMLTNQTGPVVATGNRFIQAHDGPMFVLGDSHGPVVLQGNEFASGGYRAPAQCFATITSNGPLLNAFGNTFPNDQLLPVPGTTPPKLRGLYALGNMYYGPGNTRNLLNDYLIPNRNSGQSIASLQIGGSSGFVAETQSLGSGQVINSNQGVAPVTTTAAVTLSLLPSIRPGNFNGQRLQVVNIGPYPLSFIDRTTLSGTGVALTGPTITLPTKGSVDFMWTINGSYWIQTGPVVTAA